MSLTRRHFLASAVTASAAFVAQTSGFAAPNPRVDAVRLRGSDRKLTRFGRPTGGTSADGVRR